MMADINDELYGQLGTLWINTLSHGDASCSGLMWFMQWFMPQFATDSVPKLLQKSLVSSYQCITSKHFFSKYMFWFKILLGKLHRLPAAEARVCSSANKFNFNVVNSITFACTPFYTKMFDKYEFQHLVLLDYMQAFPSQEVWYIPMNMLELNWNWSDFSQVHTYCDMFARYKPWHSYWSQHIGQQA